MLIPSVLRPLLCCAVAVLALAASDLPPVAVPTASPLSAAGAVTVTFDASQSYDPDGSVVAWSWDFGDGSSASGVSATHDFAKGNWRVRLTVTDDAGTEDSEIFFIAAGVANQPPTFIYTYTQSPTDAFTLTFDASQSFDPEGGPLSVSWPWGDGGLVVTHTFPGPDARVSGLVKVFDEQGSGVVQMLDIRIDPRAPTARIVASPTTGTAPLAVHFDASGSVATYGAIVGYEWRFPDGIFAYGPQVDHFYGAGGSQPVYLLVTDDRGYIGSAEIVVDVAPAVAPPVAAWTVSPITGQAPLSVAFDASASHDPKGGPVSFGWRFGYWEATTTTASPIVTHSYAAGQYTAQLTVTDSEGATATLEQQIIAYGPPIVDFSAQEAGPGFFLFSGSMFDADGGAIALTWDFGDGQVETNASQWIHHQYASPGTYTVTLTGVDDEGVAGTDTNILVVRIPPVASIETTPLSAHDYRFDGTASHATGATIAAWAWDFGDGTTSTVGPVVEHTFTAPGWYQVQLVITDSDGVASTAAWSTLFVPEPAPPVALFSSDPYIGDVPLPVRFDSSQSYDNDGSIVAWSWDFGDGATASGAVVDHVFDRPGWFLVHLVATDDDGLTGDAWRSVFVTMTPALGDGLSAAIYDNEDFSGTCMRRVDPTIDAAWGAASPHPAISADTFSVRWTGDVLAPVAGDVTWIATTPDRVRVWVGGTLVIDGFGTTPRRTSTRELRGTIAMNPYLRTDLVVEFAERTGDAGLRLEWQAEGQPRQVVPQERLSSHRPGYGDGWWGTEFSDGAFAIPGWTRIDQVIDHDWRAIAPTPPAPAFSSVRWTGLLRSPVTGDVAFALTVDDRATLWVGDQLVVDVRDERSPSEGVVALTAGASYPVTIEYAPRPGRGRIRLDWRGPGFARQPVPQQVVSLLMQPRGWGDGLLGTYRSTKAGQLSVLQLDRAIDFAWGNAAPAPGIATPSFDVRWTGELDVPVAGPLDLIVTCDGAVRVLVDGAVVIDAVARPGRQAEHHATLANVQPSLHAITIEYQHRHGDAAIRLEWQGPTLHRHVVPQDRLRSTPTGVGTRGGAQWDRPLIEDAHPMMNAGSGS